MAGIPPNPSSPVSDNELQAIRRILLGRQLEVYEARIQALEAQLEARALKTEARFHRLEQLLEKSVERLQAQMHQLAAEERHTTGRLLEDLGKQLQKD